MLFANAGKVLKVLIRQVNCVEVIVHLFFSRATWNRDNGANLLNSSEVLQPGELYNPGQGKNFQGSSLFMRKVIQLFGYDDVRIKVFWRKPVEMLPGAILRQR